MAKLDEHLQGWSPEECTDADPLAPERIEALAAVLDTPERLVDRSALPPLWHWVYFQEWPRHGELGRDGHPDDGNSRGGNSSGGRFLPPIPDRRRMFAGGRLTVHHPLQPGRRAERTRSLANVAVKTGRSGEMVFVTVRSVFSQDGRNCLTEEHDYVYRSGEASTKTPNADRPRQLPSSEATWQQPFTGDPVRLFRYSALTANAHRIHYDAPYAREVEAYPDLVVHGPLLVLLLSELGRARADHPVSTVDYRLRRPVFAGDPVLLTGDPGQHASTMTALTTEATAVEATLGRA